MKSLYAVMVLVEWADCTTELGMGLRTSTEGPDHFLPIFDTREKAEAYALDGQMVVELRVGKQETIVGCEAD